MPIRGYNMRQFQVDKSKEENIIDIFWEKYRTYVEEFDHRIKEFAQQGDERDSLPEYERELKNLKQQVNENSQLPEKEKQEVIESIMDEIRRERKILDLAEDHQHSMMRHESGSAYHRTYAKFLEAIGL